MSDIHALSGAYAVDALDDIERTEFEEHLAVCAECRAEVASFRETSARVAETETEAPPASLRDSVLSGISQIRPLPPEAPAPATEPPTSQGPSRARRAWPQILVAAATVVLLAVGVLAWHPWHQQESAADQVLNAPDAVSTTQHLKGGGELTLTRSPSLGRAVLVGHDVPAAGPGKTYQMWLQQPGQEMTSAGLMPNAEEPTVLEGDAGTAAAAAVSVEPEGGSAQPSKDVVAVFPLKAPSGGNDGA